MTVIAKSIGTAVSRVANVPAASDCEVAVPAWLSSNSGESCASRSAAAASLADKPITEGTTVHAHGGVSGDASKNVSVTPKPGSHDSCATTTFESTF
jgi:hypothetical protein